eukprot:2225395-Alexandrium_andersonii.AAC.1
MDRPGFVTLCQRPLGSLQRKTTRMETSLSSEGRRAGWLSKPTEPPSCWMLSPARPLRAR